MKLKSLPILKASLGQTSFKCGKPRCICIKNNLHTAYYLSYRMDGRTYTVHIPKELVKTVSEGCQNWKRMLKNLEKTTHQQVQSLLQSYRNRRKDQK